ncbi:unnamed protein product [Notodromas monacha]|uniref:Uncharacterized protein n=1 Tax=Notodromas monacha TaxID=399045 RepID=A0A7R9G9Q8_9CRUS|nr:unnamed protein product [Notodromas monacha]CAG0912864.1 unnamed protein product [Notodromas monacha]
MNPCVVWLDTQRRSRRATLTLLRHQHQHVAPDGGAGGASSNTSFCDPIGLSMTDTTCVADIITSVTCIGAWIAGVVAAAVVMSRHSGGHVWRRARISAKQDILSEMNPCVVWLDTQRRSRRATLTLLRHQHQHVAPDGGAGGASSNTSFCDPIGLSMTDTTCVADIITSVTCIGAWIAGVVAAAVVMSRHSGGHVWRRARIRRGPERIPGQDVRWSATAALLVVHFAEIGCLAADRRRAAVCVQNSQMALPTLEALTALLFMVLMSVAERAAAPKCLLVATVYFFVDGVCRWHKVPELLSVGYAWTDARIALEFAGALCVAAVLLADVWLVCAVVYVRKFRRAEDAHMQHKSIWSRLLPRRNLMDSAMDLFQVRYLHPFSNLPSRLFFFWLNPFLGKGFARPLEVDSLGKLPEGEKTRVQHAVFTELLKKRAAGMVNPKQLWKCYFEFCCPDWILGGCLRLLTDFVGFLAPLSVNVILTYVAAQSVPMPLVPGDVTPTSMSMSTLTTTPAAATNVTDQSFSAADQQLQLSSSMGHTTIREFFSNGFVMIGVLFMGSLLQSLLSQASTHMNNVAGIRLKLALLSSIYAKCLRRPIWETTKSSWNKKENCVPSAEKSEVSSTVDELTDDSMEDEKWVQGIKETHGSVVNLISEDVNNVMMFFWMGHYIWAIPLKVAIILSLLYSQLGVSSLVGAAISILLLTPIQLVLAKKISSVQKKVLDATDERLKSLTELLQNIKIVKMLNWERVFKDRIESQRKTELGLLWSDSILWALVGVIPQASSILVTLVTFGIYAHIESQPLTSAKIFTGLALFNQMLVPLFILPITVNIAIKGVVSTRRLAEFLNAPSLPSVSMMTDGVTGDASWYSVDMLASDKNKPNGKPRIEKKLSFSDMKNLGHDAMSLSNKHEEKSPSATSIGPLKSALRVSTPQVCSTPVRKSCHPQTPSSPFQARQISQDSSRDRCSAASVFLFPEDVIQEVAEEEERAEEEDEETVMNSTWRRFSLSSASSESMKQSSHSYPVSMMHVMTTTSNSDASYVGPEVTREDFKFIDDEDEEKAAGACSDSDLANVSDGDIHFFKDQQQQPTDRIKLENVSFSWTFSGNASFSEPVLKDISLTIPDCKLTMIVGDVGAGKSSLLLGLMNELAPNTQRVMDCPIAFVSQRPWLLNVSIKDNILFGHRLNQKRYDHVIQATALEPDLQVMPDGDLTDVGDAGDTLSGGQRQRIALARALYSTAPILLLDNPLSSLDPQVALKVFNRALVSYLAKQKRTTVMVTHRLQFLPSADYIIALEKGRVVAEGTYQHISEQKPALFSEWKRRILMEEEEVRKREQEANLARERWRLLRVATKFGMRRSVRSRHSSLNKSPGLGQSSGSAVPSSFWLENAESTTVANPFASSSHKLYLSRQVSHDCVLPSDEYEADMSLHYMRPKGTFYTPQALLNQHHKLRAMASITSAYGPVVPTGSQAALRSIRQYTANMSSTGGGSMRRHPHNSSLKTKQPALCKTLSTPISPLAAELGTVQHLVVTAGERTRLRPFSGPASVHHAPAAADYTVMDPSSRKGSGVYEPLKNISATTAPATPVLTSVTPWSAVNSDPTGYGKIPFGKRDSNMSWHSDITGITLDPSEYPTGYGKIPFGKRDSNMSWHSDITGITLDPSELCADEEELEGLLSEEERKRGRVSVSLYSKYLQACGLWIGFLYIVTACAAQAAKVATDIWLSAWANKEDKKHICADEEELEGLLSEEERKRGRVSVSLYSKYLQACGLWIGFLYIVTACAAQAAKVATDIWLSAWANKEDKKHSLGGQDTDYHLRMYAMLSLVSLITVLFTHLSGQFAARHARHSLHAELLSAVLSAPLSFFDRMPVGRILNRFATDTGIIDKELAPGIQRLFYFVLLCLSSIVVNAVVVPWFLLVGVVILVVYYFLQHFFRASSRELQRLESQTRSPIYTLFSETLTGLTTIRAYKQESRFMSMALERLDLNNAAFLIKESAHRWLGVALDCLGACIVLVSCLASMLAWQKNPTAEGATAWVGLAINYTLLVPVYLAWVLKYAAEVGICGRTGSGKSTLLLSLLRMMESVDGRIFIDGRDIAHEPVEELRAKIATIPQDAVLFSGTVRSNLDPSEKMSDEKIWEALESVKVDDIVKSRPRALDAEVGPSGSCFSAGEVQLLCLGRAACRQGASILLMDEASSDLHPVAYDRVQSALTTWFKSYTVLSVAHDFDTLKKFDRIIVMENGEIVEQGTPGSLEMKVGGHFAGMSCAFAAGAKL